jgi:hypothetical protein
MYCSTCGVAVAHGLSYCNYCGAKLNPPAGDETGTPHVRPEMLVAAMVGLFIFGTAIMTVMMGVLKRVLDAPPEAIVAVTGLCFLLMLFIEAVLLRLLFRSPRVAKGPDKTLSKSHATKELDAGSPQSLGQPASVTENTTRAFDPIYVDRQKQ